MSKPFRSRSCHRARNRGFTLLELMVAVSVAAILLGVGIPSYQRFIATQRVKTAVSDLSFSLVYARSEAIKRNVPVIVAPVGNCWSGGWVVDLDVDSNGFADGTILRRQDAYRDLSIRTTTSPSGRIVFNGDGRLNGAATPFEVRSVAVAEVDQRCVSLDLSGLPAAQLAACRTAVVACS